jgi:hypothetical protein
MPNATITLTTAASSIPGTSAAANLNWRGGKPATVSVISTNTGSSIFYNIQYTLDDPQLVGGTSLAYWSNLSSAYSDTGVTQSSGSTFASSTVTAGTDGIVFSLLSPFGAVRLNSTGMTNGPLIMKITQGEGW